MRKIIASILLLSPLALLAQEGSYTLTGKIGTLSAPAKIYLSNLMIGAKPDSSNIQNGQFEFKGTISAPRQFALILNRTGSKERDRKPEMLNIYLEPGSITVNTPDSLSHAKVSGSKINEDNERLKLALKASDEVRSALMAEYGAKTAEEKKNEEGMAAFGKRYSANEEVQKQVLKDFINGNPASYISLVSLKKMAGSVPDYAEVSPMFNALSDEVKNTETGKAYASYLDKLKATAIGAIAPDFTQNDPDGNPIKLSDFKGKYVLIDFWAAWCGPCRKENPNVVKAYAKYHEKGFEILGVSLDQKKEAWIKAIADDQLTWKHVSDLKYWNNEVGALYAVRAVPQNFLLDPTGKIIAKNLRSEALEAKLAEIFK
jgi:peroxiredoxin